MILITGASGLLGASLLLRAREDHEVAGVYLKHSIKLPGVTTIQADLTHNDIAFDLIENVRPEWIINCVALTNVDWCEEHPDEAERCHVGLTRNLARAARRAGARLVYISTDSVFDGTTGNYTEEDDPAPVNVYAASKLAGEKTAQEELEGTLIVRTNIYGWNMQEKLSLAEWILSRMESGQRVPGFSDVFFNPILVNDFADILLEMVTKDLSGIYHVAGSESCSKYDFALYIADIFGCDRALVEPSLLARATLKAPRPHNTCLQTDKTRRALDRSLPDIGSGLLRFKNLRDSGFVARLKALKGA